MIGKLQVYSYNTSVTPIFQKKKEKKEALLLKIIAQHTQLVKYWNTLYLLIDEVSWK